MMGKDVVNLIDCLENEGMDSDKIIEIIRYVELTDPQSRREKKEERN